ncbi:hypothetical protein BD289DRAFT_15354 [Coniella lustricola]|uniref:Uncharacterized protein n=1 Tax=Coniella lustricola TaxID=2025994 RepID=A0A2T3A3Y5_9PEZI|nr:hypothetical protein BD289DRAFT_15354 [Coniella lustricola]
MAPWLESGKAITTTTTTTYWIAQIPPTTCIPGSLLGCPLSWGLQFILFCTSTWCESTHARGARSLGCGSLLFFPVLVPLGPVLSCGLLLGLHNTARVLICSGSHLSRARSLALPCLALISARTGSRRRCMSECVCVSVCLCVCVPACLLAYRASRLYSI